MKAAIVPPTYHPHMNRAFAIPRCVGYAISLMSKGTVLAKVAEAHPTKNLDMMKPTLFLSPLSLLHRLAPISLFSPKPIDLSFPAYTPVLHLQSHSLSNPFNHPPWAKLPKNC